MADDSVVGKIGTVTHPITDNRPGEICVAIRGGTEIFMAYSDADIAKAEEVLVIGQRSARTVDVTPFYF